MCTCPREHVAWTVRITLYQTHLSGASNPGYSILQTSTGTAAVGDLQLGQLAMDGKGRLRSAWIHAVNATGWQQPGAPLSDPEYQPSTPSKAATNSHLVQLQESAKQRVCLMGKLDREILCNALACAGASMADPLMSMVDTYYSGKLGTTALAALGANGALYSVIYFLCFTALAVLCTQAMAAANSRGDTEGCGRGFLQALAATWVVSVLLVAVLLLAPEQVLSFFADAKVMPFAKTYCMIRALSLPAALTINVCQAAFRSLLDLTTPFCVVMAANAANYILDQLLMFGLGWGMAGCGWASVISQYIGASLFAVIIFRRRHVFGIPEALTAAADKYADLQHTDKRQPWWLSNRGWLWVLGRHKQRHNKQQQHGKTVDTSEGDYTGFEVQRKSSDSFRINITSPTKGGLGVESINDRVPAGNRPGDILASSSVVTARAASLLHRAGGQGHLAGVEHGVMPDVMLTGGGVVRRLSAAADDNRAASSGEASGLNPEQQQQQQWHQSPKQQRHKQKHRQQQQQQPSSASKGKQKQLNGSSGWGESVRRMFDYKPAAGHQAEGIHRKAEKGSDSPHVKRKLRAAEQPAALAWPDSSQGPAGYSSPITPAAALDPSLPWEACSAVSSTSSPSNLRRLDSVGSDSKLPRLPTNISSWQRVVMLMFTLDWRSFVWRFLGMTVRGLLILSTYTSANLVAASGGATVMAAHQVVQQQQQLQMSFAWSFLHVGQSMTANVYHASSSGAGPKAARRLAERIIGWSTCSCVALAMLTYSNRRGLSGVFTQDVSVRQLVAKAAAPATVMLSLAWNNALEGSLLAAGDQPYVVKVYPWASFFGVVSLGLTRMYGWGLPGVWWGLMLYYLVLLIGFAARLWLWRCKI